MPLIATIPSIIVLFAGIAMLMRSAGYHFDLRRASRRSIAGGRRAADQS